jgi:hypothetical protein
VEITFCSLATSMVAELNVFSLYEKNNEKSYRN